MRFIEARITQEVTQASAGAQPVDVLINSDAILLMKAEGRGRYIIILRPDMAQTIQQQAFGGVAKIKEITATLNPKDL